MKTEIKKSQAKLFYEDKPIYVDYNPISGKLSKIFYDLIPQLPNNSDDKLQGLLSIILAKHLPTNEVKNENGDEVSLDVKSMMAVQKAFAEGDLTKDEISQIINKKTLSKEELVKKYEIYLELFKAMLKTSNLKPQDKELIESPIDSDFWDNQNFSYIQSEVDTFRTRVM